KEIAATITMDCSVNAFASVSANIIARTDDQGADRPFLVIAAHYDSVETPGANDNASGVALLLELARKIRREYFPFALEFVFFGSEEPGLLGSRYYISQMKESDNCIGMINLDSLGEGVRILVHTDEASMYSGLVRNLVASLGASGYDWGFRDHSWSDHVRFLDKGIPAAGICAGPYTTLHTDADTPDCVDPAMVARTGMIVLDLLHRL
ncbi:MAG: M20/M25/M40 family metallo-hydrolase, partial [Spirochaetales bacterium]|nr:M20/M25/M40 family metallo-hydrolase [Spirochaetales bacterium]